MKLEKKVYIDNYRFNYSLSFDEKKDILQLKPEKFFTKKEREFINKNLNKKVKLTLEVKEPILDEEERKYLSGVIRPFRDRIKYICKTGNNKIDKEYICITFKLETPTLFPYFKANTMYKGMELNKEYTLEDLEL